MLIKMPQQEPGSSHPRDEFQVLFDRIADSDAFKAAPAMRALLVYLWQHRGESISEYGIAVSALGRPPEFDSRTDATVRVHIARLRNKLREFYEREGPSFPLQLSIPLGSHELASKYTPSEAPRVASRSTLSLHRRPPEVYRGTILGLAATAVVLLVVCGLLLFQMHTLKAKLAPSAPSLPRFWKTFLADGKPPMIVVPNPVVFRWPNDVVVRDLAISNYSSWPRSDVVRQLSQKWGPPSLFSIYVSALDMEAGIGLQHYLERLGVQAELRGGRKFETALAASRNTIFLGVPRTTEYLKELCQKTNFYYSTLNSPVVVRNRNPKAGEPAEYREVDYSTGHRIFPELIIQLPARPDGGRNLILSGFVPMPVTSMLQSNAGLQAVDEAWRKSGSPDSWELLVNAEVDGETVINVSPVAMREIPATFWK